MARSFARDAEDFARLLLQTVERLGQSGAWVRAADALEQTLAGHPGHAYIAQLQARPARRVGLSTVAERVRAAEFPHLERRKVGARRNAPVFYRLARPGPALQLHLPYDVAPSHRLVMQRRAEPAPGQAVSVRRTALTHAPPKSPWRRRLLLRPSDASAGIEARSRSLHRLRARLIGVVSAIAARIIGR